jgi:hypothetical protein
MLAMLRPALNVAQTAIVAAKIRIMLLSAAGRYAALAIERMSDRTGFDSVGQWSRQSLAFSNAWHLSGGRERR